MAITELLATGDNTEEQNKISHEYIISIIDYYISFEGSKNDFSLRIEELINSKNIIRESDFPYQYRVHISNLTLEETQKFIKKLLTISSRNPILFMFSYFLTRHKNSFNREANIDEVNRIIQSFSASKLNIL